VRLRIMGDSLAVVARYLLTRRYYLGMVKLTAAPGDISEPGSRDMAMRERGGGSVKAHVTRWRKKGSVRECEAMATEQMKARDRGRPTRQQRQLN
jgi:hypothetical protein